MLRYALRRVALLIPMIFAASVIIFLMLLTEHYPMVIIGMKCPKPSLLESIKTKKISENLIAKLTMQQDIP